RIPKSRPSAVGVIGVYVGNVGSEFTDQVRQRALFGRGALYVEDSLCGRGGQLVNERARFVQGEKEVRLRRRQRLKTYRNAALIRKVQGRPHRLEEPFCCDITRSAVWNSPLCWRAENHHFAAQI